MRFFRLHRIQPKITSGVAYFMMTLAGYNSFRSVHLWVFRISSPLALSIRSDSTLVPPSHSICVSNFWAARESAEKKKKRKIIRHEAWLMFHSLFSGNTASIYICSLVRSFRFVRTSLFNGNKQFQQFGPMLALCLLVSCSLSFVLSFIRFANIYRVTLTIQSSHLTMAQQN